MINKVVVRDMGISNYSNTLGSISVVYLIYYVYAYLRSDGSPYYIGKGKGNRAWWKGKREKVQPPVDKSKIIIVEKNLTDLGAIAIERRMIRWYGRKDIGTGILRNLTDGGEGHSGKICSDDTKRKMSIARLGVKLSEATKQKMRKPKSEEMKEKLRKPKTPGLKRRPMSEETKQKLRKPRPEEVKQKIRIAQLGIPRGPMTEETKKKISIATTNKPKTKRTHGTK